MKINNAVHKTAGLTAHGCSMVLTGSIPTELKTRPLDVTGRMVSEGPFCRRQSSGLMNNAESDFI